MILLAECYRCFRRLFLAARASMVRRGYPHANLSEALAELPEPARSIYLLSARDGLALDRIAIRLDVTVATVERGLAEALFLLALDDIAMASTPVDR